MNMQSIRVNRCVQITRSHGPASRYVPLGLAMILVMALGLAGSATADGGREASYTNVLHHFSFDPGMKPPAGFAPVRGLWRVQPYGQSVSMQHVVAQGSTSAHDPLIKVNQAVDGMRSLSARILLQTRRFGQAGLIIDVTGDEFFSVEMSLAGNELRLIHDRGGVANVLARRSVRLRAEQWYHLEISLKPDGEIEARINRRNKLVGRMPPRTEFRPGMVTRKPTRACFNTFAYEHLEQ